MAQTKTEQDVDSLNFKLDAILTHLGISVENPHSARTQAEMKAQEHWAVGGAGYKQIHGKADGAEEEDEGPDQAEVDAAIRATEEQRQDELLAAKQAALDAEIDALEAGQTPAPGANDSKKGGK